MAKTQFNQRERVFLTVCVAAVPIFLLALLLPKPMRDYEASALAATNARDALTEAQGLADRIKKDKGAGDSFQNLMHAQKSQARAEDLVGNVLSDVGIVAKAKASTSTSMLSKAGLDAVQLTLTGVSLTELIDLVHGLQTQNNLLILEKIRYMRPSSNAGVGLDCVMVFSSIKRGGVARGRA